MLAGEEEVALHSTIPFYFAFSMGCGEEGEEGEVTCVKRSMVCFVLSYPIFRDSAFLRHGTLCFLMKIAKSSMSVCGNGCTYDFHEASFGVQLHTCVMLSSRFSDFARNDNRRSSERCPS